MKFRWRVTIAREGSGKILAVVIWIFFCIFCNIIQGSLDL